MNHRPSWRFTDFFVFFLWMSCTIDRYLDDRFLRIRRNRFFLLIVHIPEIVSPEKDLLQFILISDLLFPLFITIPLLFLTIFFLLQQRNHVIDSHWLRSTLLDHWNFKNVLGVAFGTVFVWWNNGILFFKFFCLLWEGIKGWACQGLSSFKWSGNSCSCVFEAMSHLNCALEGWSVLMLSVGWRMELWEKLNLMVVEISAEWR